MWRCKKKEQVALTGPFDRAQIKKKKKEVGRGSSIYVAKASKHKKKQFHFKETLDEHWSQVIQEVRFRAFTHSSSFVGNVKYDQDLQQMEIILNGSKPYTFCNVSERLYDSFEGSSSKGAFFNREIKTLHDC